ncbi:hypothetical protein, conserved [Eimeria maxima]|uniref:Uncharacterized protein n=1 Tax=Eimeria maxima TaxID=5804 RepID=U6MA44_EIMMA|nr:hypothetical protein, conserved [Eimeria maxima]CDJ59369.1 hypothetical protein, conserved [Eimeria maxima]
MASEIGMVFMFLIQVGLALVIVLGAFFFIVYHFFSHTSSEPHPPSKFRNAVWGLHCTRPPSGQDLGKQQFNKARDDVYRVLRDEISFKERKSANSPVRMLNSSGAYGYQNASSSVPHAAAAILGQQPLQQLPRPFAAGDLCTSGAQAYTQECNTACASMTRQAAHCPAELSAAALYTGAAGWRLTGQQQQPAGGSGSLTAANSARAAAALPLASASASRTDFHPLNAEESDCRDAVAAFYLGGHCCSPSRGSTSSANAAAAAAAEAASRECQTKELAQLVRVANAIESLLGASAKRRAADSTSINRSSTGGASSAAAAATGAALAQQQSYDVGIIGTKNTTGGRESSNILQQEANPCQQLQPASTFSAVDRPTSKREETMLVDPPAKRRLSAAEGSPNKAKGEVTQEHRRSLATATETTKKQRTNLMTKVLLLVCSHQNKNYRGGRVRLIEWCRRYAGSLSPDQCASATANYFFFFCLAAAGLFFLLSVSTACTAARQGGSRADFEATLEATKQIRSVFCPHVPNFFEVHLVGDLVNESDFIRFMDGILADEEPSEARLTKAAAAFPLAPKQTLKRSYDAGFSSALSAPAFSDLNELRETSDLQKHQLEARTRTTRKASCLDAAVDAAEPAATVSASGLPSREINPPALLMRATPKLTATNMSSKMWWREPSAQPLSYTQEEPPPFSETASTAASVDNQRFEYPADPPFYLAAAALSMKPEAAAQARTCDAASELQQQRREGEEEHKHKRRTKASACNRKDNKSGKESGPNYSHLSLQKTACKGEAPSSSVMWRLSSSAAAGPPPVAASAGRSTSSNCNGRQPQHQKSPQQQQKRGKAKHPAVHAFPGTPESPFGSCPPLTFICRDAALSSASLGPLSAAGSTQCSTTKSERVVTAGRGGLENARRNRTRSKGVLKKEL